MEGYEYGLGAQPASFLRRSPVREIKRCLGVAADHELPISADQIEAHHLAGGRIRDLVDALGYARKHGITLSFNRAAAQDLAKGREHELTKWVQDCHQKGIENLDEAPL